VGSKASLEEEARGKILSLPLLRIEPWSSTPYSDTILAQLPSLTNSVVPEPEGSSSSHL
jgi:hypothetical protein